MNFLIIGDLHIKKNNLNDIDTFLLKLDNYLQSNNNIQYIIFLGDMMHYHEKLFTPCLNKALDFISIIENYSIKQTIILVGNHDYITPTEFMTKNHWLNVITSNKIKVVDTGYILFVEDHFFIFMPYIENGRFKEGLDNLCDQNNLNYHDATIIFAHQEFKGAKLTYDHLSNVGDHWDANADPLIISGHIHTNHYSQKNIYYPGSCMKHDFGERTKPVITLLEFYNEFNPKINELPIKKIDLELSKKKMKKFNIEDFCEKNKDEIYLYLNEKQEKISKYKLILSGSIEKIKVFKESKMYKTLQENKKILISFNCIKSKYVEIEKENEKIMTPRDFFYKYLADSINSKNNNYLNDDYIHFIRQL